MRCMRGRILERVFVRLRKRVVGRGLVLLRLWVFWRKNERGVVDARRARVRAGLRSTEPCRLLHMGVMACTTGVQRAVRGGYELPTRWGGEVWGAVVEHAGMAVARVVITLAL